MAKLFSFFIAAFCINLSIAAQINIEGYIYDRLTREPVAAANVSDTEQRQGTYTDANGYFHLKLPSNTSQLKITFIGYKEKIVNIDETKKKLFASISIGR